ncbi:hypothetical protein EVAR_20667_1 [Eumeta japonica]|uniref:Uncharacterized protein n=1 Tax=Eumeta variegata TaxID=151549 RepID=A0A4C1VAI3_EUMVA|nr:hypothetical protein EVAR_20667_1 [Eumeta japonica]
MHITLRQYKLIVKLLWWCHTVTKNRPTRPATQTLTEYRPEVAASAVAFHSCSTSNLQEYFRNLSQKKYDVHLPRRIIVVPIMLHIDKSLRKKLAKDKIQVGRSLRKFATNLLTEAQKNFVGLTENYQIKLKLLKARSLKASNYTKTIGEVSAYLKNYCDWQAHVKWARNEWHYSVLLTGLDMYYVNAKGKKITASTDVGQTDTNDDQFVILTNDAQLVILTKRWLVIQTQMAASRSHGRTGARLA